MNDTPNPKLQNLLIYFFLLFFLSINSLFCQEPTFIKIPDTGQNSCYNDTKELNRYPENNNSFFGQDAVFETNIPSYKNNNDGTITDLNTGLMWSKGVNAKKKTLSEALKAAEKMDLADYNDWRIPTVKELYSLIDFRGYTGFSNSQEMNTIPDNAIPFINTDYFDFSYGDIKQGERYIDAQWLTSTEYVDYTMDNMDTLFGVNFADGRIKGYGYKRKGTNKSLKKFFVRFVRGSYKYGLNKFYDNKDGTITDKSTSLMWAKNDNGQPVSWQKALEYAKDAKLAGYDDWRLPNAKELQYIVDYSRSPETSKSAAINNIFNTTSIINEAGEKDYPYFWTSTTHLDGPRPGNNAVYIAFGRAMGKMHSRIIDVHGAGSQRSDPKTGISSFHGPQGDALRSKNYVRLVRGGIFKIKTEEDKINSNQYPDKISIKQISNPANKPVRRERNDRGMDRNHRPAPMKGDFISRLDKNGDNRVSPDEFDGPSEHFAMFDKNGDGFITKDEAPHGPPKGNRNSGRMRF